MCVCAMHMCRESYSYCLLRYHYAFWHAYRQRGQTHSAQHLLIDNYKRLAARGSGHRLLYTTYPRLETETCDSLACQTACVGVANEPSGHCCTHSGTTAGMLAEPIKSLRALDETNMNFLHTYCERLIGNNDKLATRIALHRSCARKWAILDYRQF